MSESEYRALWDEGCKLIAGRVHLDGKPLPEPGFFERLRLRKASAVFQKAAAADPLNGAPLLFLGKIEERLGRQEKCVEWLLKANAVAAGNLIVTLELGSALGRLGRYQESIAVLGAGARANPSDARVHSNLGVSLLLAGDAGSAIHAFEHVLKLEPEVAINRKLLDLAIAVSQGRKPAPKSERDVARNI